MTNFHIPKSEGSQSEQHAPDKSQCLECALGKLLAGSGVKTAEQEKASAVISDAQSVSTVNLHTRATIYRCNAPECGRALLAFTLVDQPLLPEDTSAIRVEPLLGSSDCLLPKEELPQIY